MRRSGADVGVGPFDDKTAELLLPAIGANGAHASFDARPPIGSEVGSSSGEGSPWAEQEVLAGSPAGRTSTITTPPEIVASRAGDLTPWSSGGLRAAGPRD